MNDKKRSLRMRDLSDSLPAKGFGGMKISFLIPPPLNFSNRTITAFDLQGKTNFKNAIFTESTLNDATFKDIIDFTGANFFKATLNGVTFENCNLTKAIFSLAKLNKNTRFINCILSNSFFVDSDSELYSVTFKSCTFTGVNFSGAKIFKNAIFTESILNDATFKNVDFTGAKFFKATLNGVIFENCNLTRVDFSEANLYTKIIKPSPSGNTEDSEYTYIYTSFVNIDKFDNAVFKKAKLYGVAFKNCNLTKADFSEAELTVISYKDGNEYTEEYTVFDKVNLKEANFKSATLYSVSFKKNVNLREADFTEAELSKLYISDFNVYLEDTLFVGANIKEVDFSYANYFGDPEAENYDPKKEEEDIEYRYDYDVVKILSGLDFSDATLEGVNLAYSTFEEVNFSGVNFSGANLLNVDFANSNLAYSNFSGAILETNNSVNLNNINFDNADLSDAQITNEFFFNTSFYSANLENVHFNKCWFKNLSFNESTFFGGDDTRTEFIGCYVYIDDDKLIYEKIKPSEYFLNKVSIEKSFINDSYIP